MPSDQLNFFIQYLLFPAIVALLTAFASAVASYRATYKLNEASKEQENKARVIDLAENLLIEVNRLIPLFEKLRTDFDRDNYFALSNIDLISSARWRMVELCRNVTVFEDNLRKIILENSDSISTLIDELYALERNPVQEFSDLRVKLNEIIKEERSMRLELLKMDIVIKEDDEGLMKAQNIGETDTVPGAKLDVITELRNNLVSGITEDQNRLDRVGREAERKRERLVSRIIDTQNKLKSLQDLLIDAR